MAHDDWDWTVRRMMGYGAPLKNDEVRAVVDYLTANFLGPSRPKGVVVPGPVEATITEWSIPTRGSRAREPIIAPDGRIYYVGHYSDRIGQFDPKTGQFKEFRLKPKSRPHGAAADREGNIWFTAGSLHLVSSTTGADGNYIGKLDPRTGAIKEYRVPDPKAVNPMALVFDKKGTLFFTVQAGNMVGRMNTKNGEIKTVPVPTPNASPFGILINSIGVPYFAEFTGHKLGAFDPKTMEVREFAMPNQDSGPRRLAVTPDDVIWYGDYSRGYIGRFSPKTGEFKEWPSPSGRHSQPEAMAAIGHSIWYSEDGTNPIMIVRFDTEAEKFQSWPLPSGGGFVFNMIASPDGDLWIANAGADKIGKVEIRKNRASKNSSF